MERDAEYRIAELELRLAAYHEHLAEVISERDRLALDAAWGVHSALHSAIICAIIIGLAFKLGATGWAWLLVGIAITVAQTAVMMWSNAARMREVERLAKLPDWTPVL